MKKSLRKKMNVDNEELYKYNEIEDEEQDMQEPHNDADEDDHNEDNDDEQGRGYKQDKVDADTEADDNGDDDTM